jgi:ribonuclease P protein component
LSISSLKSQKYFDLVNKKGVKIHNPSSVLVLAKNYPDSTSALPQMTLGMKVNKKLGNAVIRNKIKRRIRHLITIISKQIEPKLNLGLIVVPRKGFQKIKFATLELEFSRSLLKK